MGVKHEQKLLKAIEDYRRIGGRFLLETGETLADQLVEHLLSVPGVEKVTPAGSLRRGRDTVGDLDILVTGPGLLRGSNAPDNCRASATLSGLMDVIAQGENKLSSGTQRKCKWTFAFSAGIVWRSHAIFHRFQGA